ncbi:MAG: hypothetical protein KDI48_17975, partial [Xanthomonadales bacterium]|nr:hypothetical protein [Xanthomonadales bacterium]
MLSKRWSIGFALLLTSVVTAAPLPRMHPGSVWYQRVDSAPLHPNSAGMIGTLSGLGGFGNGRLQIDFSNHVNYATGGTATQSIISIPSGNPDDAYYL